MRTRNIFLLLIVLPLVVSIQFPFPKWNWDFKFDWNILNLFEKFKSALPQFVNNMKSKIQDFMKKTEDQKNAYLQDLNKKLTEMQQNIKEDIKQRKETFRVKVKDLMEKATEAAKFLSYKVCDTVDMDYEECRRDKKKLVTSLLLLIRDNFGQCSVIIGQISRITENAEMSLKYILFLVNAITENPDAIEKAQSQILFDVLHCLQYKVEEYWPMISADFDDHEISLNIRQDITSLLLNTYTNLVNVIHQEEIDGDIEKADNRTGLIHNPRAQAIQKGIFEIMKRLNQFGQGFYKVSANLALNIFTNPGNLNAKTDAEIQWVTNDDKGIKISLHSNYMLREKGAASLQAVVFDSPLVSLRARNEREGGTSNTFVGITLYDKDGNEIIVKDFDIEELRPEIFFKKRLYGAMEKCLYYNAETDTIENKGILSAIVNFDGEEYIKCIPKHLSVFTIGSYENSNPEVLVEEVQERSNKTKRNVIIISSSAGGVVLMVLGFFLYRYCRRKSNAQVY